ncbi:MAG: phosphatidate cytidylyltransferase [Kiritimatiellae bacterium]|nr:phosphatidate cytidylyltransferase [Kiritimatiellia bacterium]
MNPIVKRTLTGIAVGAAVIAAILLAPPRAITPALVCIAALATVEFLLLLLKRLPPRAPFLTHLSFLLYFVFGELVICTGLDALDEIAVHHGNMMLLYVVAVVKFSDVGGFAFGTASAKLMKGGNHKLCPAVSPGKSWEGLFGSVVFSCVVSCAFMPATHFAPGKALAFGLVAALFGTAGDLIESKFKRWVGVKDSSTMKITNGMGGILDMLDSLIIAPAVLLAMI